MQVIGNIVDLQARQIFHGAIDVAGNRIGSIKALPGQSDHYILPGFVDAHVHIESSMLVPSEFAKLAVVHGTVATVSDPHEIANVCGMDGVKFMLENGRTVPLKFHFGAPSCVPATTFETAGDRIDAQQIELLLRRKDVLYLSEMMNYPGVIHRDPAVMEKLQMAARLGKPVDGHAPGLRGDDMLAYFGSGISTDHECFDLEEAREKAAAGVHILIREGSAAKNFDALHPLIREFPKQVMFCSDDKHPDDLLIGHINGIAARAIKHGHDLFDVLNAACCHPVRHYGLDVGQLRPDDPADFIIVEDLQTLKVTHTYIEGVLVGHLGAAKFETELVAAINRFDARITRPADFLLPATSECMEVIVAEDGSLITGRRQVSLPQDRDYIEADPQRDLLKIAVHNRYRSSSPAVAMVQGMGLQRGAIASSVAHDSHNIIAVGTNDVELSQAVNALVETKGGICAVDGATTQVLPLPVAGLMSDADGQTVARHYAQLDRIARETLGSKLSAPFMTLSFLALLVIPQLKLSDQGLFDAQTFRFVPMCI